MESTTAMLFSKANMNAELSKDSEFEDPKDFQKDEKQDIPKESTDNISSVNSGINSMNSKEENAKEKDIIKYNDINIINDSKEQKDFFFPIVSSKTQEESKNSEANILSAITKAIQEQSNSDFSSVDLKIPDNMKPKSTTSTTQTTSTNLIENFQSNLSQMFIPNYFSIPNPIVKKYFGKIFIKITI